MYNTRLFVCLLWPLLLACQTYPRPRQGQQSGGSVNIQLLLSEYYSGIDTRMRSVIRDAEEWRTFWDRATGMRSPKPQLPAVSFADQMVIVAAMGRRGTGGYAISIERVYRDDAGLVAVVKETSPGSGCMLTQALTAPLTAVAIPRSDDPLRFQEERERLDCS